MNAHHRKPTSIFIFLFPSTTLPFLFLKLQSNINDHLYLYGSFLAINALQFRQARSSPTFEIFQRLEKWKLKKTIFAGAGN
jgi:hypothetical protein